MRSRNGFLVCLALMALTAVAEFRAPDLHPLAAVDRACAAVYSQTDLAKTLQAAERAAKGE